MKLFIGLDVSLAKPSVCVISEHGKIIKEAEAESEPEVLACWLNDLNGSIVAVGLEAGPLSQWLHRGLTEAGLDAVLMETRQVKGALKAMPIKTDRRVAEGIARLLHLGWFRPVHCKSESAQEIRAVLGDRRRALCRAATVMINRGRSTWLRTWGAQLAQRRGRKIAMVALARRIACHTSPDLDR